MDKVKLNKLKSTILSMAEHPNANIRKFVAIAIRELNIKENTVSVLNKYIIDKQPVIRLESAKTIRYVAGNTDSAVSMLIKRLGVDYNEARPLILGIISGNVSTEKDADVNKREPIADVKKEIAISIAWLDHSLIVDPLLTYLNSDNESGKIAGAVGLGNVGHPKALEALEKTALDAAVDIKVRKAAIVSIGKIKSITSFETLKTLVEDKSDEIRKETVIAMNHVKHEESEQIYIKTINDDSPSVREVSCIALGNLKDKQYMPNILGLLNDLQPNVRKAAASVLGSWREKNAIPFLLERIEDGNDFVQNEVVTAYLRVPKPTSFDLEEYLLNFTPEWEENE